jgi:D-serine deaminase-like pyridoxal phosphate-dependent protein
MPDASLPRLLIRGTALESNVNEMQRWVDSVGAVLAPHAKTTLSPALVRRQMAAGAWGATAASVRQARGLVALGVSRVIVANEVVDPPDIAWMGSLLTNPGGPELFCFVDSSVGLERICRVLEQLTIVRPLGVLIEHGYTGGRAGTRSVEAAIELARKVTARREVYLAGVSGYEGQLQMEGHPEPPGIRSYLREIRNIAETLGRLGILGAGAIVSAGGSSYYDIVVEELAPSNVAFDVVTVLRSGCYITHDHGLYARSGPQGAGRPAGSELPRLRPALELRASILSTPEPGLAIAGFGRRHVPIDDQLPLVLSLRDEVLPELDTLRVRKLNDQHAYLDVPPWLEVSVGDVLTFGISHPCGAFDRWRSIDVIDDHGAVTEAIQTDLEDLA